MTSTFKKLTATAVIISMMAAPALSRATPLTSPQAPAPVPYTDTLKAIDTIGAMPMTDEAASEVRGEGVSQWAIKKVIGFAMNSGLVASNNMLAQFYASIDTIPSYGDYKRAFGDTRTARFFAILPWYLKPYIVQ